MIGAPGVDLGLREEPLDRIGHDVLGGVANHGAARLRPASSRSRVRRHESRSGIRRSTISSPRSCPPARPWRARDQSLRRPRARVRRTRNRAALPSGSVTLMRLTESVSLLTGARTRASTRERRAHDRRMKKSTSNALAKNAPALSSEARRRRSETSCRRTAVRGSPERRPRSDRSAIGKTDRKRVVGTGGIEPPTPAMSRRCSKPLSYVPVSVPETVLEIVARSRKRATRRAHPIEFTRARRSIHSLTHPRSPRLPSISIALD